MLIQNIFLVIFFVIVLIVVFTILYKKFLSNETSGGGHSSNGENTEQIISKSQHLYEMGQLSNAIKALEDFSKKNPNEIAVRFLLGDYLVEKTLVAKAQKHFSHILKLSPSNSDAIERVSDCHSFLGQYDKALNGYNSLLSKSSDDNEVRAKVAEIYTNMKNYDQAITEYRTILATNHYDTNAKENLGDLFFLKGDYKRAVSEYEAVIKIEGSKMPLLKKIAKSYSNANCLADAANAYKRIIEQDECEIAAYKELAEIYIKLKNYDKAAKVCSTMLEKGIKVPPDFVKRLADIYLMTEDYAKAVDLCKKLISENPDYLPAIETLGMVQRKNKNYSEAIHNFKHLIIEDPNQSNVNRYNTTISSILCDWGQDFSQKKDYQTALDKFVEAIQYDEQNPEIYLNLGKTNHLIKNNEAAVAHFDKAIALSKTDPSISLRVGEAFEEIDQMNTAIDMYYDAAKRFPSSYEIKQALGIALGTAGFYSQAEIELACAVNLSPENPNAYYNLALVYEIQGKKEDAIKNYEKTLKLNPDHEEAKNNLELLNNPVSE